MDRLEVLREIAEQLEGEIARGIRFWSDEDWNREAREFLGHTLPAPAAAPARPSGDEGSAGTTATGAWSDAPAIQASPAGPPPLAAAGRTPPESPPARVVPAPPPASAKAHPGAAAAPPAPRPAKSLPRFGPPPAAEGRDPDWEAQLAAVEREARGCVRCALSKERTNVVFNSGSGRVPLVFVGEGPGADEDAQGEAFVGRAGQLLTKIIAAIGLDRADVYICNVVKCRPPGNRAPLPEETEACRPYLQRQLEIIKPRAICALGLAAAQLLLETKAPIGKLRGKVFMYNGVPVLPTYHPAFLLRSPGMKRVVWEDVQVLRRILDEGAATAGPAVAAAPVAQAKPPAPRSGDLFS
ncbi:MAG: uracil-DNA glycosylase [Candidatus Eisenbacteria bacterium]|uniref:Type-4 uracil-DNA glycosylase n=1 Tax=Eiseniibacteriota bacterium TaxID=2212470 RepID=A0A937XB15_UNCEI|nr:uracil-DNA glycosylase [Candidatus Eisenbacteria bacterium]